ncbi:alcohol dehydrogenase catalytic domain-containing protein [Iocasia frigidifontis]|uniref:Alcohol dehydrogenase catalytic domain-containing protein n=1 Tax=Iocasia fonsfrigidae TaxID=2682810 RepID=A0A8A7K7Z0_9FIRM|nr:zinc-binding dehydrogenase [Iocasia fonsfrigidae]QTL97310.1 alcohol dehydrogenase catalytic domain-containing protein [Iocasia fonsfrigidae]
MKAVVKYALEDGSTEVRDVPIPKIGPTDVLVKVDSIGICGSDPHMHHNNVSYPVEVPLILGHEFSGIIDKVGEKVEKFSKGDRVTAETHAEYCGKCVMCRTNNYHLCQERKGYGFGVDGAYASYVKVPERILHRVPDNVSLEEASLTEPLCVAYNLVVNNMTVNPGDVVVVIGPGPIGILSCNMAAIAGASEIIMIGTNGDEKRLEKSKEYGATTTINSGKTEPLPIIKEKNEGYGADVVIDAAGPAVTLKLALEAVRPEGTVNKIAWGPKPINYSLDKIIEKAITLRGSFSHTWDVWEKSLKLLEKGQVDLSGLITHQLSIEEWERGFELVESKEGIKVVLKP